MIAKVNNFVNIDGQSDLMDLEALIKRVAQDDHSAFADLYSSLAPMLLRYAYKLCADRPLAEDSLQETFVDIWNQRAKCIGIQNVKSYFLTSLRRKIFRKLKYSPSWNEMNEMADFNATFSVRPEVFKDIEEKEELITAVLTILEELSPRQKEIVYLKYFQGMDYDEIQHITGLEYQSLRNHMSKALKRIREMMPVWIFFLAIVGTFCHCMPHRYIHP